LAPADLVQVDDIPCTSPARTIVDLSGVIHLDALERAVDEAERRGLFDLQAIEEVLERSRGRRGVARLRSVIAGFYSEPSFTRSELERRFLALCRRERLPKPATNVWVPLPSDGCEVDFIWEPQRLVAEVVGLHAHGTRLAFEEDRRRDQRLAAAGYLVVGFTWNQVATEPVEVAATLRTLLGPAV
jgi:very-short-patch-repair endonuclease